MLIEYVIVLTAFSWEGEYYYKNLLWLSCLLPALL